MDKGKYVRKSVGFFEKDLKTLSRCPLTRLDKSEDGRNFSLMVSKSINFTNMILRQGKIAIGNYYTIEEAFMLVDIFQEINYEWECSPINFLKMEIADAVSHTNYFKKWKVDHDSFRNKIENLNLELAIGTIGAINEFLRVSNIKSSMATELILEYFNIDTTGLRLSIEFAQG